MILNGYIFSILYVVLCVLGAILLYKCGLPKKYTRKFVHVLVGFEWVILNHFMGNSIHFLAICMLFTAALVIDYKVKLVPAMSSEGENAPGTVYYALAMTVLAAVTLLVEEMMIPFGVAVFCTSFGDGFAGIFGQAIKRNNPKIYGSKTLIGVIVNFVICFATPLVIGSIYSYPITLWQAFVIAIFAVEIELFVSRGLDNILLSILVALLTFSLVYWPDYLNYILPIIFTPAIIALSRRKKVLTVGGIILALCIDVLISISLHNFGFTVLLTFFVGSVVVDKIKKHYKKSKQNDVCSVEKRGDCRDVVQVFANGGVATCAAVLYFFTKEHIFILAFVASLAEAFADTVASGVGMFSNKVYDVFRRENCEKGLSGGMSVLGTASSLFASFFLSMVAILFAKISFTEFLIIGFSGFLGAVFDSMLGSLLQVKYKCKICGKIIEKEEHCNTLSEKYRGIFFVNNDVVNFVSTLFSALISVLVFLLI